MDSNTKMDNVKLKAEKSVKFLGVIFDHKLTFEDHIKDKINNTKHVITNYYSLRSKKYRIPDKTRINLYKIFIRPNFDCGNAAQIPTENKYIYKWEQIQMNVLRFPLNLSRNTNNNIVRKCANISSITERIIHLAKSWYGKWMINNLDIKEFIRTALAFLNTLLAYINN